MTVRETITCENLDEEIERYASDGFLLDMIMPADDPREALMSRDGESLRLLKSSKLKVQGSKSRKELNLEPASRSEWIAGRAGMMYRDLIPDRLGGKVIASHIRIVDGGDVADRVHYHKIGFQIIYCLKGAIRVVYEDCGEPFWLKPGDCVLQPPEIRHRVLEADAGSEVIEITSPAEHETWFDHALTLPTNDLKPDRIFGTQRLGRHIDADSVWNPSGSDGIMVSETKVPGVRTLRGMTICEKLVNIDKNDGICVGILINGRGIEAKFSK